MPLRVEAYFYSLLFLPLRDPRSALRLFPMAKNVVVVVVVVFNCVLVLVVIRFSIPKALSTVVFQPMGLGYIIRL